MQLPLSRNAESEQTRMLFLDFHYNSIVNILPRPIPYV